MEGEGMSEELKPCPFCGGEAHIKEVVSACEKLYTVGCPDSECMGYETWLLKPTVDEAVAAWNRRAERTCRYVRDHMGVAGNWFCKCSECGAEFDERVVDSHFVYCPECGARVIGEETGDAD